MIHTMDYGELTAQEKGIAGEHRVASELLLRGYRPLMSIVDDGADIILDNGVKIQVKTAFKRDYQGKTFSYAFSFWSTFIRGGKEYKRQRMVADYAICWCVTDDVFFILPKEVIGDRKRIALTLDTKHQGRPSRYMKYKEAWGLIK